MKDALGIHKYLKNMNMNMNMKKRAFAQTKNTQK